MDGDFPWITARLSGQAGRKVRGRREWLGKCTADIRKNKLGKC